MDIFRIVNITSWVIVFIVTFYVCFIYFMRNYGTFESLGVPGPKPFPLIGNLLEDLLYITHEKDISNNKKYGRVYGFWELTKPSLRVSDPAILREVLVKQFNNFIDRRHIDMRVFDPVMSKMMIVMRGEEWRTTRNVMSPTFTSGKLKQMVNLIEKCSQKLVNELGDKSDKGESLDAKNMYITHLLEVVGSCAFGVETSAKSDKNEKTFVNYAKRMVFARSMITFLLMGLLPWRLVAALKISFVDVTAMSSLKKIILAVMKARESGKEKRNDFMQLMLDALKDANTNKRSAPSETDQQPEVENKHDQGEDQGKQDIKAVLTENGVIAQSILFLLAGFEGTSAALSFASYIAATHPECQDKLIEEVDRVLLNNDGKLNWETMSQMTYLDMFFAEILRMYSQGTRTDRECTKDTKIGDLIIRKGTVINVMVYAIHHDEEFYPDPYKFDPERFSPENKEQRNPYTYMAFGIGPRSCIGMRFALMEVKLTFIHMLKNFRFCPSPKTKEPLAYKRGHMFLTPKGGLYVTLSRR